MHVSQAELIEFLVDTGLASRRALEEARDEAVKTSMPLGQVIVARGLLSESDMRRAQAHLLGVPYVDLTGETFDLYVLSHVPEPVAREHNVVAIHREGDVLEVALLDMEALPRIKFIETAHGVSIAPRLTDPASLKHALVSYRNVLRQEFGSIIESESQGLKEIRKDLDVFTEPELRAYSQSTSIARILGALLSQAVLSRATNIHIDPTASDTRVRFRHGGALYDAAVLPKHLSDRLVLRVKHLAGLNLRDRMPQEGKFVFETDGGLATFRVHTTPVHHGEKAVLRILPESASGFTLESLGLQGRALEVVERALHRKEGLVLAAGPKGGGKSTFLYTALDIINLPERNIHTVENPIEYIMPRVHQTQVNPEKGLTFARAVRTAALSDADAIMISGVEDAETAKIAVSAALSGDLVLAGIEAPSAAEGIARLIELGAPAGLVSSSLSVCVGMGVVRKLGREREMYHLNQAELRSLGSLVPLESLLHVMKERGLVDSAATWEQVPFWKSAKGAWSNREYVGHIGIFEVIHLTPKIRELVMNGAPRSSIMEEARISGSITLLEDGIMKAVAGLTTLEEVLHAVSL